MQRALLVGVAAVLAVGLAGCSTPAATTTTASPATVQTSTTPTPTTAALSTTGAATAIKTAVPTVTAITELTAETDVNHLLGRPNGYTAATVLTDTAGACASDGPGVACGATIEQWPDAAAAQNRASYIAGIAKSSPVLANEYDTVAGSMVLRVDGTLTPDVAKAYATAFTSYAG